MPTVKVSKGETFEQQVKPGDFEREMRKMNDARFTKHDDGKLQWSRFCWRAAE